MPTRRCCATGHFPPLSPRDPPVPDPRAGDAYALLLPTVVVGYQLLGNVIVVPAADHIRRP